MLHRFETFTSGDQSPAVVGKRLRVAATSVLNINVTAANLATFAETAVSWRRIVELEQRAAKLSQVIQDQHISFLLIIVKLNVLTA